MTDTKTTKQIEWEQDGGDPLWWTSRLGAVRGAFGNRGYWGAACDGWWFLPSDKPDRREFDVGPFRSRREAMAVPEVRARWNAKADASNQWDALGQNERSALVRRHLRPEKAR